MTGINNMIGLRKGDSALHFLSTLDNKIEKGVAAGGERALMSAILFDGIQAFITYASSPSDDEKQQNIEALRWVQDRRTDYVFSFENVCECLGVNPDYLRCGLINAVNSHSYEWRKVRRNF